MTILFFFIIFLLNSSCFSNAAVQDFCVGDVKAPEGPAGYSCKNASLFPGLNGLHMSVLYIQMGPDGIVPAHTHPRANEIIVCISGTVRVGFISTGNKAYTKTLQAGDVFIFPQGLVHFQMNVGKGPAKVLAFFSSSNPGIQTIVTSLFGNDLATATVEKISFIDADNVKKLKAKVGGTN
ncbi:Germin protein [Dioscorea alata]|uniref:Germin protein n=1 Tax=Dioscorea alata TaxID=55571 RepID=A0ACB7U8Q0_DIOAL|nr:Germin protein [Dioscorea alata]